jgi:hypothetical protein
VRQVAELAGTVTLFIAIQFPHYSLPTALGQERAITVERTKQHRKTQNAVHLTQQSGGLSDTLTGSQSSHSPNFMNHEGSLPCAQKSVTGKHYSPDASYTHPLNFQAFAQCVVQVTVFCVLSQRRIRSFLLRRTEGTYYLHLATLSYPELNDE